MRPGTPRSRGRGTPGPPRDRGARGLSWPLYDRPSPDLAAGPRDHAPLLYRPAVPITIRPVTADELLPWFQQLATTFFIWPMEPEGSTKTPWATKDLDRRIAAFDGDRIVGTYRTFAT